MEFLEQDRITKIRSIMLEQNNIEDFFLSFSGGRDSTVLSRLLDVAIPDNKVPRVFCDTGIEFNEIRNFVKRERERDSRIVIIPPSRNIKELLQTYGYPFKSKEFAERLHRAREVLGTEKEKLNWMQKFITGKDKYGNETQFTCPDMLKYLIYTNDFPISDKCCYYLKEAPIQTWSKENKKPVHITALLQAEGGRRANTSCLAFKRGKLFHFNPFAVVPEEFISYLIDKYNIELCKLYYPPYNFKRTGCKGCPFNINLQSELETIRYFFPSEAKQCEHIWKPVYEEYRKIGYRLRKNDQQSLFEV